MSPSIFINDNEINMNKVRFIHCKNWEDFTKKIKKVVSVGRSNDEPKEMPMKIIYRGQALKEWKLASKLERAFLLPITNYKGNIKSLKGDAKDWYDKVQKEILSRFKFLSAGIADIDFKGKNDDEIWALGRHNGLITPLLDWTESIYIAAFFAFIEQYNQFEFNITIPTTFANKGNTYIWGLRIYSDLEIKDEFEIVKIPRNYGSRLWAQAGLFTKLYKSEFFDIESYLKSRGIAHYLDCYEIPLNNAAAALSDLKLMNISYSRLFPDLTGAAQEANIFEQHIDISRIQKELIDEASKNRSERPKM